MSEGMKVAVYHSLHSGGAKRSLFEEARRLALRHRLDLFTLSSADHVFCDIRPFMEKIHIYDFEPGPLFSSPFGRLNQATRTRDLGRLQRLARRIAREIDAGAYDVVLVHPSRYSQSPQVLQFLDTPTVYYCHEPMRMLYESEVPRPYRRHSVRHRVLDAVDPLLRAYRSALRRADWLSIHGASEVLVNSRFTQKNVRRIYGLPAEVCYHGVDVDVFHPLGLRRNRTVLSIGSLTPNKGFDAIIEGIAHVPEEERPSLVIISNYAEDEERAYLEDLARDRAVTVTFHTGVTDDALVEAYNRAQMVVYTPVREPFGLVPLEAMACGTPVVGVREGGVPETVEDGLNGLLVNRDPEKLGEAIRTLLEDDELAERYGVQGKACVAEKWTWEQAVQRLEDHLRLAAERPVKRSVKRPKFEES
jgi:glycosyltransferase involved in cell wall biosynthesis